MHLSYRVPYQTDYLWWPLVLFTIIHCIIRINSFLFFGKIFLKRKYCRKRTAAYYKYYKAGSIHSISLLS